MKRKVDSLSNVCPVCGLMLVLPIGPLDARAIIVSDRPGEWELRHGRPFVPQAPAGHVLHHELIRAGLSIDEFRVTNVWLHEPNGVCLDWHVEKMRRELAGRDALLILGLLPSTIILERPIMSVSGLRMNKKDIAKFVRPLVERVPSLIVVGPNPAEVLHGGIGEFRLALSRFAAAYHKLK